MCSVNLLRLVVFTMLQFVLGSTGYQSVLFMQTKATANYLAEVVNFTAMTKIECASNCLLRMNVNVCAAFALNESTNQCMCGKKRFAPVHDNDSETTLHIASNCPKIQTGEKAMKTCAGN